MSSSVVISALYGLASWLFLFVGFTRISLVLLIVGVFYAYKAASRINWFVARVQ